MTNVRAYVKAATAGVVAGLTAAGVAVADGRFTAAEAIAIAVAAVGTFASVYAAPANAAPTPAGLAPLEALEALEAPAPPAPLPPA